jgi:hypothetical protein
LAAHAKVLVRVGAVQQEIDEAVAPLVEELWQAGIDTWRTCQEDEPGLALIDFPGEDNLLRFLAVVARYDADPDSVYQRSLGNREGRSCLPAWQFDPPGGCGCVRRAGAAAAAQRGPAARQGRRAAEVVSTGHENSGRRPEEQRSPAAGPAAAATRPQAAATGDGRRAGAPALSLDLVLSWADEHRRRTG